MDDEGIRLQNELTRAVLRFQDDDEWYGDLTPPGSDSVRAVLGALGAIMEHRVGEGWTFQHGDNPFGGMDIVDRLRMTADRQDADFKEGEYTGPPWLLREAADDILWLRLVTFLTDYGAPENSLLKLLKAVRSARKLLRYHRSKDPDIQRAHDHLDEVIQKDFIGKLVNGESDTPKGPDAPAGELSL